jgi:hypothetical protein
VAILEAVIACPACGIQAVKTMPTDACVLLYRCAGRSELLAPLPGACCTFCSYGDAPCPPKQDERA